jgi:hypothetical protein
MPLLFILRSPRSTPSDGSGRKSCGFPLIQPHQLRRVVLEHHFHFLLLDAEAEQRVAGRLIIG